RRVLAILVAVAEAPAQDSRALAFVAAGQLFARRVVDAVVVGLVEGAFVAQHEARLGDHRAAAAALAVVGTKVDVDHAGTAFPALATRAAQPAHTSAGEPSAR